MLAYLEAGEIKTSLQNLINEYVQECMEQKELSQDFIELVKHNFLAKYVYYNKERKIIEIGINESKSRQSYPAIQVYSFPLAKAQEWLGGKFKNNRCDLEFYGSLINSRNSTSISRVVVM
ncbi:hypothetical protein RM553_02270 [Zunongwangia sp. F363]|uniref:Uncharacterized protein n=1 Tax=Autumnicola tepida TaxID=3075595 RepID=A0ABU3C5M5_9FLAO|nr:hypothetical protein [Zunongwangia sp. F363]MDT0641647.1 hypothetical protein [Zunongwangia sp. F363]